MANKALLLPSNRLFNNSNVAVPGGTASLYLSGTTTPANFLASDGATSLGSTITANGLGQLPDAYGDENVAYRLILKDSLGAELDGGDIDPFRFGVDNATITITGANFTYNTTGAVQRTTQSKLEEAAISPEDFGAVGNGVTDDYAAFVKFVAALSGSINASARLGKAKTYFIGQHATATNGVVDLIIQNAVGLTFDGNGATVSFDGSFDRNVSTTAGIGFEFVSCSKLKAFNFTVNGNVQNTTNSSASTESFKSYGIFVGGCVDCEFDNIETHHCATDGFSIGPVAGTPAIGSKGILVSNLYSHHNARTNFSVFLAERVRFVSCRNEYAAVTGGTYGFHSPGIGTDIEPDQALKLGTGDINTNNIHFEDCRWNNNAQGDLAGILAAIDGPITFTRCSVVSVDSTTVSSIIVGVPGLISFRDCHLDVGTHRMELPGSSGLGSFLFDNCDIMGSAVRGSTIYSADTSKRTVFRGCSITCTATAPKVSGGPGFFTVNNPNLFFFDNDVFLPSAWFVNEGSNACKVFDVVMRRASGNRYSTDLATAGSYFYTKWNATRVLGEHYAGTITGTADTIRPALASSFDTNQRYYANDPSALVPVSVTINGGTPLTKAVVYTPTLTPASVAATTVAEQTFTVTGLTTADKVIVNPPAIANATGIEGVRVSAADTLAIRFANPTAGALTPTSGIYNVLAFRS